jgi:hypothetical protein
MQFLQIQASSNMVRHKGTINMSQATHAELKNYTFLKWLLIHPQKGEMDSIQYRVTSTERDLHMTNPQIRDIPPYYEDVPACW